MYRKPRVLRQGDTVGLVTVSSPVSSKVMRCSCQYLVSLGFRVEIGMHALDSRGYMAGSADDRALDLNAMLTRPDIRAVFCSYGGISANQLLPLLDYDSILCQPKIFVGLSDPSVIAVGIQSRTGITTFHGPTGYNFGEAGMTEYTESHFVKALCDSSPIGDILPQSQWTPIIPGTAEGPIVGCNLTLLQTLVGTPWEPDWTDKILFWEDIFVEQHSIDLMLTHLALAGVFRRIRGMIIGKLVGCEEREYEAVETFADMIRRIIGPYGIPVLADVDLGHTDDKITVPIGVSTFLQVSDDKCRFCFMESATESD